MQLCSKSNRALERTWQDDSVMHTEDKRAKNRKTLLDSKRYTLYFFLFLPQWWLFLSSFIGSPTSSWSHVRMPQGSGLQLFSTFTLTPLVISSSLIALNKNQLLTLSLHSNLDLSLKLTLISNCLLDIFNWLSNRYLIFNKMDASIFFLSSTFLISVDGNFILNFSCLVQYLVFIFDSSLSLIYFIQPISKSLNESLLTFLYYAHPGLSHISSYLANFNSLLIGLPVSSHVPALTVPSSS